MSFAAEQLSDARIEHLLETCRVLGDGFANNMVMRSEIAALAMEVKRGRNIKLTPQEKREIALRAAARTRETIGSKPGELERIANMGAWTRAHGKSDANPFSKENFNRKG